MPVWVSAIALTAFAVWFNTIFELIKMPDGWVNPIGTASFCIWYAYMVARSAQTAIKFLKRRKEER